MLFHDNAQIVSGNKTLGTPDRVIHYYDITRIEKYQDIGYQEMVDRTAMLMQHPSLRMNTNLIVDGTGIGDATIELMRSRGLFPTPIVFSGGETPREHYAEFGSIFKDTQGKLSGAKIIDYISVPKKDLVDAGKLLIQQGRLRVATGRWSDDLTKQLLNFKGKVNEKTNHIKYEAETEQIHDDLVVVLIMGSWWILNRRDKGVPEQTSEENVTLDWEPNDFM
jgi:hypothetical protein